MISKRHICLWGVFLLLLLYCYYFIINKRKVLRCTRQKTDMKSASPMEQNNDMVNTFGDMREFDYDTCRENKLKFHVRRLAGTNQEGIRKLVEYECSHLMTSSLRYGGLGNYMFQIASLIGVATRHGYTPVIDNQARIFQIFELLNGVCFELSNILIIKERVCCEYNRQVNVLDHNKNWTMSGYLQSWKYFEGAKDRVRQAFRFKRVIMDKVQGYLKNISKSGVANIGIHVRRGDILTYRNQMYGYTTAPASYIRNAMKYFYDKYQKVHFILASDDLNWCKDNFKDDNIYFSPFNKRAPDMALLASCDHTIITSGTFGWWIGWLSKGQTVYYRGFPKKGSWLESQFNKSGNYDDYYPIDWIGLY